MTLWRTGTAEATGTRLREIFQQTTPRSSAPATARVHRHRWPLASRKLAGTRQFQPIAARIRGRRARARALARAALDVLDLIPRPLLSTWAALRVYAETLVLGIFALKLFVGAITRGAYSDAFALAVLIAFARRGLAPRAAPAKRRRRRPRRRRRRGRRAPARRQAAAPRPSTRANSLTRCCAANCARASARTSSCRRASGRW